MRKLVLVLGALVLAQLGIRDVGAAHAQVGPPCCSRGAERQVVGDITVEIRAVDGTSSTFQVLANGDAALLAPQIIIGRIRGQRFLSANLNGRWVTAPPEVWLEAAEGTRFSLRATQRRMAFLYETPIQRTGETRTVAGIVGEVYTVPSLRGGSAEAVFSRDPSLQLAAEAYYDILDFVPATGAAAHLQAAVRNAGFPLAGELSSATRIRFDRAGTGSIRLPSSFVSLRELRRLVRR
jgi:hypothetical protein